MSGWTCTDTAALTRLKVQFMRKFENIKPVYSRKVRKVIEENYRVKTIEIEHDMRDALPGQFLMVWVPGEGERPMSIGNSNPLTISVASVGKVSSKLHELRAGDMVSYRGPFGRPFRIPKDAKSMLVIGGGYGVVPMYFLARVAKQNGMGVYSVVGGKTGKDIIWEKQLFTVSKEAFITTDDGSRGKKGTVMIEAEWLIGEKKIDQVYACGPEKMMLAAAKVCHDHGMPCQVSVERHMKCGVGICGSCDINGHLCCQDGPVFTGEEVLSMPDFGKRKRDASGKNVDI
ncbi:dihydroorotate dehydrogenase electron transfer subunit [Candidatus Micrarchaeota archaeon]|nr:dihydroorotate dehydrogenase electron transfer subunit [Candidatus Micrarchaeota archaeon]